MTPGALWVVIAFAGMLGLGRSLTSEIDRGSFDALLLTPVDRSAIFLGKALGIIVFMFAIEAVILPLFVIFFNLPFLQPTIILIVVLGTIGYGGIGTLLATMSANTRLREVLLPVLLLPDRDSGSAGRGEVHGGRAGWPRVRRVGQLVRAAGRVRSGDAGRGLPGVRFRGGRLIGDG